MASNGAESSQVVKLTKQQIKTLQEAMYHSAESGHLGNYIETFCIIELKFIFFLKIIFFYLNK